MHTFINSLRNAVTHFKIIVSVK